jgi:ABC-type nitrate/sulfonate/bicarbonate transport system permease component
VKVTLRRRQSLLAADSATQRPQQRLLTNNVPAVVLFALLIAFWELYVRIGKVSVLILPPPSAVAASLVGNWDVIALHTGQTLLETLIGIAVAIVLGAALAILLDLSLLMRRAIYPLLVVSQTIPIIALAPLLLIWFGFDIGPKVIVVTLYCFFPITVSCVDGLSSAQPELIHLLKSMRASRWQILRLVRLPGAMPSFFSGLRIAATYSVTGAIFGEFVGAYQGLGIFMENSANSHALDLVFAAIVVTALLSLALFALVSIIERLAIPWYHGSRRRV